MTTELFAMQPISNNNYNPERNNTNYFFGRSHNYATAYHAFVILVGLVLSDVEVFKVSVGQWTMALSCFFWSAISTDFGKGSKKVLNFIGNFGGIFCKGSTEVKIKLLGSMFPEKNEYDGINIEPKKGSLPKLRKTSIQYPEPGSNRHSLAATGV